MFPSYNLPLYKERARQIYIRENNFFRPIYRENNFLKTHTTLLITNWLVPIIVAFFIRILILTGLDAAPCSTTNFPITSGSIELRPISGIPTLKLITNNPVFFRNQKFEPPDDVLMMVLITFLRHFTSAYLHLGSVLAESLFQILIIFILTFKISVFGIQRLLLILFYCLHHEMNLFRYSKG